MSFCCFQTNSIKEEEKRSEKKVEKKSEAPLQTIERLSANKRVFQIQFKGPYEPEIEEENALVDEGIQVRATTHNSTNLNASRNAFMRHENDPGLGSSPSPSSSSDEVIVHLKGALRAPAIIAPSINPENIGIVQNRGFSFSSIDEDSSHSEKFSRSSSQKLQIKHSSNANGFPSSLRCESGFLMPSLRDNGSDQ